MPFIVHVSAGPTGHLPDFLELLSLDLRGPVLHRFASELEERSKVQFCGKPTR